MNNIPLNVNFRGRCLGVHLLAIDDGIAALVRTLLRVAIDSLQERSTAAERQVVCTPFVFEHERKHSLQRVYVDSVALNDAQVRRQHLEAFTV